MNQVTSVSRHRVRRLIGSWLGLVLSIALALGCGTTRMTDTQRTATEQLLISNAVDQAVSHLDFSSLAGKLVYFDPQYLDNTVDRGYVVSSLRQRLLASGCILQEDRTRAAYVVEARSGCVGTDRHSLLIGVPQMTVPTFVPGQPSQIPEIPVAKKTDELGAAKLAVFAYNRHTGQRVWQSGTVEAYSNARDLWVAGLGPFRKGTIRHGTELAGEELAIPLINGKEAREGQAGEVAPVTSAATWREPAQVPVVVSPSPLFTLLAQAALAAPGGTRFKLSEPQKAATGIPSPTIPPAPVPPPLPPPAPNLGGQAETAPAQIWNSAFAVKPGG
jgi:hypothetical protein